MQLHNEILSRDWDFKGIVPCFWLRYVFLDLMMLIFVNVPFN